MKSAQSALAAAKNVLSFPLAGARRGQDELAFLPAALEIIETPPPPLGRAVAFTVIALFSLALIWSIVGRVDIVASAPGKIVPTGRVKLVQPLEIGVVRAIHVRDGQGVRAGDALIELDPTVSVAEAEHIRSDLIAAQLEIARLKAALSDSDNPEEQFRPPSSAKPELVAMERGFLLSQTKEHRAKLASLDRQRAQKEAERATTAAAIDKLEADEPIISQRLEIRKYLVERELGSKLTYLEALQQLTENEKDIAIQKNKLAESAAAVAAITATRAQAAAEFHRTLYTELADQERKEAGLTNDLAKAEARTKRQVLTAPVDGIVQQLAVHTVGGVVTPAQQLAVVVPSDAAVEVEAQVSNRDIGFVHLGQAAQIKVDTFNFTRYGVLHGRVLGVSPDAIANDGHDDHANGRSNGSEILNELKSRELVYTARISLDQTQLQVDGRSAQLSPGMQVMVDIKTGTRRIISYLFSPILRYAHDSMHER